jgi:hypothetical protein
MQIVKLNENFVCCQCGNIMELLPGEVQKGLKDDKGQPKKQLSIWQSTASDVLSARRTSAHHAIQSHTTLERRVIRISRKCVVSAKKS